MRYLNTPESRFADVPFPYTPQYTEVEDNGLRMAYVDDRPTGEQRGTVLLLHGEPTWSFLYRSMIPLYVDAGYRVVAPDLIGFGRSSKPTEIRDHSYARHVTWVRRFLDALELRDIRYFGQDWGSLIGLRLVGEDPDRFSHVCIGNGYLPSGDGFGKSLNAVVGAAAFMAWRTFALYSPWFSSGRIVRFACKRELSDAEWKSYDAPFPSDAYMAGPRAMPRLVPITSRNPACADNVRAWDGLASFDKPFLTLFSTGDPIMRGLDRRLQRRVAGAKDQPHERVRGGHFLQEDSGEDIAARMIAWMD